MVVDVPALSSPKRFDWVVLIVMVAGFTTLLRLMWIQSAGLLVIFMMAVYGIAIYEFRKRFNWKNISAIIIMISLLHPIRLIFNWSLNPPLFGTLTGLCALILMVFTYRSGWRNGVFFLLVACTFILLWHTIESRKESCRIEDRRWNYLYVCGYNGRSYQQILSSPFGMEGFCYYCPWYTLSGDSLLITLGLMGFTVWIYGYLKRFIQYVSHRREIKSQNDL